MVCRLVIHWLPVVALTVVIVGMSVWPIEPQLPKGGNYTATFMWGSDKIKHAVGFALIGLALHWALSLSQTRSTGSTIVRVLVFGGVVGGFIEVLQPFVDRTCDLHDFVADIVGLIIGCALFQVFLCFVPLARIRNLIGLVCRCCSRP